MASPRAPRGGRRRLRRGQRPHGRGQVCRREPAADGAPRGREGSGRGRRGAPSQPGRSGSLPLPSPQPGPVGGVTLRGVPRSSLVRPLPLPPPPGRPRAGPGVCGVPRDTLARVRAQPASSMSVPCPPRAQHQPDAKSVSQAEFGSILPGARSCPEGEIRPAPGEQTGRAGLRASPFAMPLLVLPSSRDGCGQEWLRPALQVLLA